MKEWGAIIAACVVVIWITRQIDHVGRVILERLDELDKRIDEIESKIDDIRP
jgi:hypothetical protein